MSDWLIVRVPFDNPNKPEIVEAMADIPLNWKKYLSKVAKKVKRTGRYLAANILYQVGDAFYPNKASKDYRKMEKKSGD